jgi:hypothetical protein
MRPTPAAAAAVAVALALVAPGCAADPKDSGAPAADGVDPCGPSADPLAVGFTAPCDGGGCAIELRALDPDPPGKGDNTWTVAVAGGWAPTAVTLTPTMPAHGHGTQPASFALEPAGGAWITPPVGLFMAGLWRLEFALTAADGATGSAVLRACVEG